MKAISPVRSARSCFQAVCCISEASLAISRNNNKHACADEPAAGALCDMNDCYSKLKSLVPSIPQNQSVSQVEILQHVIDYIFDLQIALEAEEAAAAPEMVLSIQTADLTHKFSKDEGRLCH
ncbi:DNA-binding protein inhibitor ID-3 [Limanda limanda]|uniref:DNA-binding protein inhibitor ID-3 n=1 Tax=Limanda limanda TaxID=27771 RepID=UPI0029C9A84E|nr:DNA-binding protein inhibitor ID-3 [Limanda limanda]